MAFPLPDRSLVSFEAMRPIQIRDGTAAAAHWGTPIFYSPNSPPVAAGNEARYREPSALTPPLSVDP